MPDARCFGESGQHHDRVQYVGSDCMRGIEQFSYAGGVVVFGVFFIFVGILFYCFEQSDIRIHQCRHWLAIAYPSLLEDFANVVFLRERNCLLLSVSLDVDS